MGDGWPHTAAARLAAWTSPARIHALQYAAVAIGLGILAFLFLFRLSAFPYTFYDEGAHLHVAKNLALNGTYADYSSEGNRYGGPVVGVGPTVIVPIAALYRLFGVDLTLGRLVIVLYSFAAMGALFALGRVLQGKRVGLLALALFVALPGVLSYGRMVVGEVPGAFFILVGLWSWLRPGPASSRRLLITGALFGLACITKNQYALIVLSSIAVCWLADLMWYRRRGARYFLIPLFIAGAMHAGWTYYVLMLLGRDSRDVAEDLRILQSTSAFAFLRWDLGEAATLVKHHPYAALLFLLSLPPVIGLARHRTAASQNWGNLVIFVAVAGLFYLSSLGWPRYAFLGTVLALPLVAHILSYLSSGAWFRGRPLPLLRAVSARALGTAAVAGMLGLGVAMQVRAVVTTPAACDTFRMAEYLQQHVPKGVPIETLEQEYAILTDRDFHYPSQRVIVDVTAQWSRGNRWASQNYDNIAYAIEPDYVLVHTKLMSRDFYSPARLRGFGVEKRFGSAVLYRRGWPDEQPESSNATPSEDSACVNR
jgi:4-amino-4-deoxy-L-arabinose transferase-like glycosyltransferase